MYELIQVSENNYYIQCPAKIGLIRTAPDRACLIDSGNDGGRYKQRFLGERFFRVQSDKACPS